MSDLSLIMTAAGSIFLLLFLVLKARMHALVALILVSMLAGLFTGMNPAQIADTIQKGMGGTLGFVAVVLLIGVAFAIVRRGGGSTVKIGIALRNNFV